MSSRSASRNIREHERLPLNRRLRCGIFGADRRNSARRFVSKQLARPKIKDSAEIYIGDEFIGTLTREDEDGELCYQFQMAILEMDLEDA